MMWGCWIWYDLGLYVAYFEILRDTQWTTGFICDQVWESGCLDSYHFTYALINWTASVIPTGLIAALLMPDHDTPTISSILFGCSFSTFRSATAVAADGDKDEMSRVDDNGHTKSCEVPNTRRRKRRAGTKGRGVKPRCLGWSMNT
jgi:hypothetical protein